ncbi:membrane protein [Actinorhabdospora filicis]|uniref:Membrane protein n=1 Tax=Actinorhabdospora filicis TaxID=1785913 RepID=A0A9W6SJM5_9ACTN|nr:hemolysin family protein [Actinorhabdospora filicis]GLZ77160.1 membrane protein [Actinorhabdospora filicis]
MLLTAGNAFFVAAEYALVTVDRPTVEAAAEAGDRRAKSVSAALRRLSFQLSGAQLGITITALLTGYLAQPAIARIVEPALGFLGSAAPGVATACAIVIAMLVSTVFGELVPKNAALARSMPLARATAGPLRVFSTIFGWLIAILNGSANWLVRRMGIEPQEELATARSRQELGLLAVNSGQAGTLSPDMARLLRRSVRFNEKRAAEAMTPRVDVEGLPVEATVADLFAAVAGTGHSRFPVYADDIDTVVGIVSVNDALGVAPDLRASTLVRSVAREPVFVPEHLDLDSLLARLRESGDDIAVVVDEYGGTDGVVTIEDLVEELVGEISDEHDFDEHDVIDADAYLAATSEPFEVDGVLRADELAEQTGFEMPDGPYETLAGFIMSLLGHIPVAGEVCDYEGWEFHVVEVDRHRIERVVVVPPPAEEDGAWD